MDYKELQDWIIAVRDEILYPIANDPQNSLTRLADGLGQESVALLEMLDKGVKEDYAR